MGFHCNREVTKQVTKDGFISANSPMTDLGLVMVIYKEDGYEA